MRADILKALVRAYADGDDDGFRKAALQAAAAESEIGHIRVAEELRNIIARLPVSGERKPRVIDLAQPRGELADVLEGGFRDERMRDIVLTVEQRGVLERIIQENRSRGELERWGVGPRRKLLFAGPPGTGKTLAAGVLAGELGVPMLTVRLDALFSRFLGATAAHLRSIFNEMPRRPGVYLFDEFDAVGKARGDALDVGELQRVVTSFLQMVDSDHSSSILIAATNHPELLDRAVFRRFELKVEFDVPGPKEVEQLVRLRLAAFELPARAMRTVVTAAKGFSYADIAQVCDDAVRTMALAGRDSLTEGDLKEALAARRPLKPARAPTTGKKASSKKKR